MLSKTLAIILTLYVNEIKLEDKCNRININNKWYEKEVLITNSGRPHNLLIHKNSAVLFFSFSILETYLDTGFQIATYDMKSTQQNVITGIPGACAVAIDQKTGQVFLGGSDGIYKYNVTTQSVDFYEEKNKNIWSLFFYKYLFYISYPDQKLHMKLGKKFTKVKEFYYFEVDHFHATDKFIYFANKTGLYRYDRSEMTVADIKENISVRQFTEDNKGVVYACTNLGVFSLDNKIEGLRMFVDSKFIHGMAFDSDNQVIMSDGGSVFKLHFVCNS